MAAVRGGGANTVAKRAQAVSAAKRWCCGKAKLWGKVEGTARVVAVMTTTDPFAPTQATKEKTQNKARKLGQRERVVHLKFKLEKPFAYI